MKHNRDTPLLSTTRIAIALISLVVFFAILSHSAVYALIIPAALALIVPNARHQLGVVFSSRPVVVGLIFLGVILLGMVTTPAVSQDQIKELEVYAIPMLLLPCLIAIGSSDKSQPIIFYALLLSAFVTTLKMLINASGWSLFRYHSVQEEATLVAIGCCLAFGEAAFSEKVLKRRLFLALGLFQLVILLGGQTERVGMVLGICAPIFICVVHSRLRRYIPIVLLAGVAGLFAAYQMSPGTHKRINHSIHSIRTLTTNPNTSLGIRWNSNKAALELASAKPIWGYGTGTFSPKNRSTPIVPGHVSASKQLRDIGLPESGFLLVTLRHGLVGLFLIFAYFLCWFCPLRAGWDSSKRIAFAAVALLLLSDCSYPSLTHSRGWVWFIALTLWGCLTSIKKRK